MEGMVINMVWYGKKGGGWRDTFLEGTSAVANSVVIQINGLKQ